MTLFITLTLAEADTGPFNIFSDVDGFTSALAINVSKATLLAGLSLPSVPDGTTIIRIRSVGLCTTILDMSVGITTTTTTSSTTTIDPSFVLVYRVNNACCTPPNLTERLVVAAGFVVGGPQTTFTGTDGKPYTLISTTPIMGIPNISQSGVDTNMYGDCIEWLSFYIACP